MKCPKCQFENPEESKFFLECGRRLEIKCPQCGQKKPLTANFCNGYGHQSTKSEAVPPIDYTAPQSSRPKFLADKILTSRSPIEGERKQVTVMFHGYGRIYCSGEKARLSGSLLRRGLAGENRKGGSFQSVPAWFFPASFFPFHRVDDLFFSNEKKRK